MQPVAGLLEMDDDEFAAVVAGNLTTTFHGHAGRGAAGWSTAGRSSTWRRSRRSSPPPGTATTARRRRPSSPTPGRRRWSSARRAIRVNAVAPGLIDRPGLAEAWPEGVARWEAACPLGRLGQPEDVADACLFLASPAARWITGAVLVVDGGVLARPTW